MRDLGHEWTQKRIDELEERIRESYREAIDDIQAKMDAFIARFAVKNEELLKRLEAEKITPDDYKMWLAGQVFQKKRWQATLDDLTDTLARANELAMQIINDAVPEAFAYNANWATYSIEKQLDAKGYDLNVIPHRANAAPQVPSSASGAVSFGFGLYDRDTVKRLLRDEPKLLPPSRVDIPKDKQWNMGNITRQIMQGIVQGESLEQVAQRLTKVADMNIDSARTHAQTAMGAAQNAGRLESYRRTQRQTGYTVEQEWIATLDGYTREAHGKLDGQHKPVGEPFEVTHKGRTYKIMYPCDPAAAPCMVYNCRCTTGAWLPDFPGENAKRRDDDPNRVPIKDMTFTEWMTAKGAADGGEQRRKKQTHQKTGQSGQKIISQALYNRLIKSAVSAGAHIERNEAAERHLDMVGASASQLGDVLFFRREATVSDVLEEVHHFQQRKEGLNADKPPQLQEILNEIEAKRYLISVAERYKIPVEETETTKIQLEGYLADLERWEADHESD